MHSNHSATGALNFNQNFRKLKRKEREENVNKWINISIHYCFAHINSWAHQSKQHWFSYQCSKPQKEEHGISDDVINRAPAKAEAMENVNTWIHLVAWLTVMKAALKLIGTRTAQYRTSERSSLEMLMHSSSGYYRVP